MSDRPQHPYTPAKPPVAESAESLRARIPGWGVDLDPADRPSVPREQYDPDRTGAWWEFPDRQSEPYPRERSIEHVMLPPVFGTAQPLRGVSGGIRRLSYTRYSEARAAHWLLLLLADRVETYGAIARSTFSKRPDNPVTESGVVGELTGDGLRSRIGQGRTDTVHHPMDPVIVAGPWLVAGWLGWRFARRLAR